MRRHLLAARIRDVEVDRDRRRRVHAADGPRIRAALPDLRLGHVRRLDFGLQRRARADGARDFKLARRDAFQRRREAHHEVARVGARRVVRVPPEDAPERFLEDGLRERVAQDRHAARPVHAGPHLVEADLVERTREAVDDVRVGRRALGQPRVERRGRLQVRGRALDDVLVRPHVLGPRLVHDHARADGRRPADEEHRARALPGRRGL
mmetsp:Transcript_29206/g.90368  ORF Transcript_29206/g.90368 Transcript_29206/m.90368 type:complete len:209 (+) Transcript_29206:1209-1835(+)